MTRGHLWASCSLQRPPEAKEVQKVVRERIVTNLLGSSCKMAHLGYDPRPSKASRSLCSKKKLLVTTVTAAVLFERPPSVALHA